MKMKRKIVDWNSKQEEGKRKILPKLFSLMVVVLDFDFGSSCNFILLNALLIWFGFCFSGK